MFQFFFIDTVIYGQIFLRVPWSDIEINAIFYEKQLSRLTFKDHTENTMKMYNHWGWRSHFQPPLIHNSIAIFHEKTICTACMQNVHTMTCMMKRRSINKVQSIYKYSLSKYVYSFFKLSALCCIVVTNLKNKKDCLCKNILPPPKSFFSWWEISPVEAMQTLDMYSST